MKLDVFGHKMLGETALFLSDMVGKDTGMKSQEVSCSQHFKDVRHISFQDAI